MGKYKNRKIKTTDGLIFQSRKEYRRWCELLAMQNAGIIKDLKRQVKYVLIPTQREPDTIGKRGGIHQGKVIEKECAYYADFCYQLADTGETVVEDTKGYKGGGAYSIFKIKKKLMLYVHHIKIKEI